MAFRAPRYSYLHAFQDVGVSAVSYVGAGPPAPHADFPLDNLIDDRAGTLFKFAASTTDPWIVIDLGAGFVTGLNRLIIPANHNIPQIRVSEDTVSGMGTHDIIFAATAQTAGTLIDCEFSSASTKRYIGIKFDGTGQFYMPQIFLTKIVTIGAGVALADSVDSKRDNVTRLLQKTGLSPTVQNGPQQRYVEYEYESPLEGADLTAMEALVDSVGMSRPFYVDPASFSTPPKTDEPALAMKFAEMPGSRNTILVPMSNARSKAYRLRLIESLD